MKHKELSALFMVIREKLSKSVARIVPPDEIEDIVQETYVRVCQYDTLHEISYPRTFMFKTAKNIAIDYLKRSESVLTDSTDSEDDFNARSFTGWENEPLQRATSNDEFALFCSSVRTLPRQCRRAFVLKKVFGLTQKEIAARLNISERTVEKHIALGITRCGRFMSKHTDYGKTTQKKTTAGKTAGRKKVVNKLAVSSIKSDTTEQQSSSTHDEDEL